MWSRQNNPSTKTINYTREKPSEELPADKVNRRISNESPKKQNNMKEIVIIKVLFLNLSCVKTLRFGMFVLAGGVTYPE